MTEGSRFLDFGRFRLDRRERLLYSAGEPVSLPPKAADLLVALTEEPGRLYSKEELIARVWPDVVVDESSDRRRRADYALAMLYAALGDRDHAFQSLDDAIRIHYSFVWELRTDAAFDSLRDDPRYRQLLAKLNL
ncbi:MAG TPA: winged helix-turn-helix domain-containing protein [Thermoanaerobaculia bacterium]|jgi:DNA-binding winged helix-turn-helix (wHTH) protein